jgi:hypothetical protein
MTDCRQNISLKNIHVPALYSRQISLVAASPDAIALMIQGRQLLNSKPRAALVVLGMHRSGTSALTRVLNLLGAALPQNLMPPGPGNELGHWEPIRVAELHDEILSRVGSGWSALKGPDAAWFDSPQAAAYVGKIKELVRREYFEAPLIVIKDPRLSLLFPLWARALEDLGIACKPIVALRNPLEIARSLCLRDNREEAGVEWRIDRAGLLALHYNLSAERWTRSHKRAFCHFDDLLRDWRACMRRLGAEFDVAWPNWSGETETAIDAFLRPSHRHHKASDTLANDSEVWVESIAPVYQALREACAGRPIDPALFDQFRAAYSRAYNMFSRCFDDKLSTQQVIEERDRSVQRLERQIALLTGSTSWRMTAPLRRIVEEWRAWRDGLGRMEATPPPMASPFNAFQAEPAE